MQQKKVPQSLLVIKPSSLGDVIHGLQVAQTVKRRLPQLRITWIARERFAPIVQAAECVDEVVIYQRKDGLKGVLNVMKELRRRTFDMVWDMQGLLRSGLMTWAAKAPLKYGRADGREGATLFYKKVALPEGKPPFHAMKLLLKFASTLGVEAEIDFPLRLKIRDDFSWKNFFDGGAKRFVIFTDSRGVEKEWRGYEELTRLLFERIDGAKVAWCAGKKVAVDFGVGERFLNLTGCAFDEMLALAMQPSFFIGNDSGPMHLSAAVGNRVLAIFGPTSPHNFGPWPPDAKNTAWIQAPNGIMANLTAAAVVQKVASLIV